MRRTDNCFIEELVAETLSENVSSEQKKHEHDEARQTQGDYSANMKRVGMFYYAEEKLFSPFLLAGKVVSGVVVYVDESSQHGLIASLRQKVMQWSRDYFFIEVDEGSGIANTALINKIARRMRCYADAAQYCFAFALDGIKAGEAFLPSEQELEKVRVNLEEVNHALRQIKRADLFDDVYYLSSTTRTSGGAVRMNLFNGDVRCDVKNYVGHCVRPFMAF